jgi:hypothetical protein
LGEAFSYSEGVYRCSLSGVPSSMNEALFLGDSTVLLCQKGAANAGLPSGVVVSQFLRYFGNRNGVFALVKLGGTGVTSANDLALLNCISPSEWEILLREGDVAPDTGGARVGTIQQVDAEAEYEGYAVVVSLTGCASSTNQALYRGTLDQSSPAGYGIMRRPELVLRKGVYQTLFGKTVALSSIKLSLVADPSGAGSRGLGVSLFGSEIVAQLTMSDGSVLVALCGRSGF